MESGQVYNQLGGGVRRSLGKSIINWGGGGGQVESGQVYNQLGGGSGGVWASL